MPLQLSGRVLGICGMTTNNHAELAGVTAGLSHLQHIQPTVVTVVGDSRIVLDALRCHRPFRQERLRRGYVTARTIADALPIRGWYHHLRG